MQVAFPEVKIKLLPHCYAAPCKAEEGSAGYDVYSADDIVIERYDVTLVRLGFQTEFPQGITAFLLPRSSLPIKYKLAIANSIGLIDSSYRGEYKMELVPIPFSHVLFPIKIPRGTRIGQLVFISYFSPNVKIVQELSKSSRGECGFGSSGD